MKGLIIAFFFISSAHALDVGTYQLTVQFESGPSFVDILTVNRDGSGTFTVPGGFTAPITILTYAHKVEFILNAQEGQREINFNFIGDHTQNSLSGIITDLNINREIGTFKGKRLYEGPSCN